MDLLSLAGSQTAGSVRASLSRATDAASSSISRLSSGSRLVRAADDVASMAISEKLTTRISSLRLALNNALQGQSYLGVADGALQQINDMLQRMNALAVQSGSGSLSTSERGFLNQEFRNLYDEIDRIAANTDFNGIKVLQQEHGDLFLGKTTQETEGAHAYGHLVFTANLVAGDDIRLNAVTVVAGTDFAIGGDIGSTLRNMAQALNTTSNPRLAEATYEAVGNTLIIRHKATGALGNVFTIDEQGSGAAGSFFTVAQNVDAGLNRFMLQGGTDGTESLGVVRISGNTEGDLITGQDQVPSSVRYYFQNATNMTDGDNYRLDDGVASSVFFTFRNAPATPEEVQIGATGEETMRNLASHLNHYLATSPNTDFIRGITQLEFRRDGDQFFAYSRLPGIPYDFSGTLITDALDVGEAGLGIGMDTPNGLGPPYHFDSGRNTGGVNTDGIINRDFIGEISGFAARYLAADSVELSLNVGEHTYRATVSNTNITANTSIFFSSEEGGYFSVELAANQGMNVANQQEANRYGGLMDEAFKGLTFMQKREITKLEDPGLQNVSMQVETDDFTNLVFQDFEVTSAEHSTTASITFTLNGETFEGEQRIGQSIGAYEVFTFKSTTSDRKVDLIANGTAFNLSTDEAAQTFKEALERAYGAQTVDIDDAVIISNFQVGAESDQVIGIKLNYISSTTLFNDTSINIASQQSAEAAVTLVQAAIDRITQTRAQTGALQKRFEVAGTAITDAITQQDAARAVLEDTDIAAESTRFATESVKQNASISMLAQTNQLTTDMITRLLQF